jgi:hypothetical protein
MARNAPEVLILIVLYGIAVVWGIRTGLVPGPWMLLLTGLALVYCKWAIRSGLTARGVSGWLGLCLPLAIISTYLSKLALQELVGPDVWRHCFYLGYLLPLGFLALWCGVLLPTETRRLVAAAARSRKIAPLLSVAVLLAVAAVLVSCADLGFERGMASAIGQRLKSDAITPQAWATNLVLLFSAYLLIFALSSRMVTALLVVSPPYIGLWLATIAKIKFMHSAVQPLDLIRIPEFLPLFRSFFGAATLAAVLIVFAAWLAGLVIVQRRVSRSSLPPRPRRFAGALSLAALAGILTALAAPRWVPHTPRPTGGRGTRIIQSLPELLGAPAGDEHREKARNSGFLLTFLSELPTSFVSAPPGYSLTRVKTTMRRYSAGSATAPALPRQPATNLIIYLVESFMDPADLRLQFTSEPIPHFRSLRRTSSGGYAIVPERFGGSANTEFELLTGMSRSFLPEGSLPYRQYLRDGAASLPCVLKRLGYVTIALQADPKYYYDRPRVYNLLCFDEVFWLHDTPGVERSPRGGWPTDRAVVDRLLRESRRTRPFFAFVFPSSTHSPYNFGVYRHSDLGVIGAADVDPLGELQEYVNSLRVADEAVGQMMAYFRGKPDSTIIAVLGDHVPPLSDQALLAFRAGLAGRSNAERERLIHRVPLLVWTNFQVAREEIELSTNALPSYLLSRMGIARPGLFAVVDSVRKRIPVVASYAQTADGKLWDLNSLPAAERLLLDDYRLLQYDLLLGTRYSAR